MKYYVPTLTIIALLLSGSRAVLAQSITVTALPPVSLTITTAVAGSNPTSVSNGVSRYTLVTKKNAGFTRITARIPANMPANTTLSVTLVSPGGTIVSAGTIALSTTAQVVLSGLPNTTTTFAATALTYKLDATPLGGVIGSSTRVVTFAFAP
ncbi:MAG: hypothetical protein JWN53_1455 [Gemmatimonadetes bacterium]|nr:hypothetical protein [Gemmatimonadota bacterium]